MKDKLRVKCCLLILQTIPNWTLIKTTVNSKVAFLLSQKNPPFEHEPWEKQERLYCIQRDKKVPNWTISAKSVQQLQYLLELDCNPL